jgi:hypothetical protein
MDQLFVEIIIRASRDDVQKKLPVDLLQYRVFDSPDKVVFNVPRTWKGFENGMIISLQKDFKESIYLALAYFCRSESVYVTDFEGKMFQGYDTVRDGQAVEKYVKKRIQIVELLNSVKDVFTVRRYILDLKFTDPIVKVLDVYSDASNGGVPSKDFMK